MVKEKSGLNLLQTINFNITLSAPVGFDIDEEK